MDITRIPRSAWVGAVFIAVVLVAGVVLLGVHTFGGQSTSSKRSTRVSQPGRSASVTSTNGGASVQAQEDAIAAKPMLNVGTNWLPQAEVNASTPGLALPKTTSSVGGVASGFPKTPEGAVAQLAALDTGAYSNFSLDTGRAIYNAYAMPGAVSVSDWEPTNTIMQFYADNPSNDPSGMTATFTPVQGLIKGTADGGNFVVACVLGRLQYSYQGDSALIGAPDCDRMQWSGGRWMLAPGAKPAEPPLVWPRNAQSYQAGFRDLTGVGSS